MRLAVLASTSAAVAAASSRKAKTAELSAVFAALVTEGATGTEIEAAVGLLTGAPRQGRIGIGWATVAKLEIEPVDVPSLDVLDIDQLLVDVAQIHGPGSAQLRAERLLRTLTRATATELNFCRMILVGELRQGALAGVVSDAIAKTAGVPLALMRRATMLQGDLGQAAVLALHEGEVGLRSVQLAVGRAVEPMLASTAASPAEALEVVAEEVSVEWKLDGARIQVHRDGDEVRIFTRNLNDMTARLGGVVETVRTFECESCVLDGEVLGMTADGDPAAFQDTMSSMGADGASESAVDASGQYLHPSFFDLLFLDGESLIDRPLRERQDALHRVAARHLIPTIQTQSVEAADAHLAAALEAGHEGVMIKSLDGVYEAGRRGKSWRKVKPVHTLDLVVLAAEWGHGRRQGWLSNLHLGARHPETGELIMVGKTFKGLTDELLAWQTEAFLASEVRRSSTGHTVYVAPVHVVEIGLDGAQGSTRYPGGVALRFARVRAYRPDKSPEEADTLDAVRALLPRARRLPD